MLQECTDGQGMCPPFYVSGVLSEDQWQRYFRRGTKDQSREALGQLEGAFRYADDRGNLHQVSYLSSLIGGLRCVHVLAPTSKSKNSSRCFNRRTVKNEPNLGSMVLWLSVGNVDALFGADLNNHKVFGWEQFLRERNTAGSNKATYIKVPHHGSQKAHHEDVYDKRVETRFVAALTRNNNTRGRVGAPLPDNETIASLKGLGGDVYVAGTPSSLAANTEQPGMRTGWISARHPIQGGNGRSVSTYGSAIHV